MQETHLPVLVIEGAGLDNRAHQHLNKTAADGIEHNRKQDARKGSGAPVRQERHGQKTGCGQHLGGHHTGAVADFVGKFGGRQVNEQLGKIEDQRNQGDFFQRDSIGALEGQK